MAKMASHGRMPIRSWAVPELWPAGAVCTMLINIGWLDMGELRSFRDWRALSLPTVSRAVYGKTGRGDWIRTSDLHTPSVMRYQAALRPD